MALGNQIPDKTLLRTVTQTLAKRGGGARSRVTATVRSGEVTLTGAVNYEHERRLICRTAGTVSGVRRVVDQVRVEAKKKSWD